MKSSIRSVLSLLLILAAPGVVLAGPVNINKADAATLAAELTGVGAVLAEEIVRDREANGPYETPESLTRVRGIGMRIVEMNQESIRVDDSNRS